MIESSHQKEKTNGGAFTMSLFFEIIHEHTLVIDFSMFMVIWIVQLIVYPSFLFLDPKRFLAWHTCYCRRISYFVLPLMSAQLINSVTSCFFVGSTWEWARLIAVLSAWAITFFHSAPRHKVLSSQGKVVGEIESLIRGNLFRSLAWTMVLIVSFWTY